MSYDQMTGHEAIKTYLKNALSKGAVSHAYLFDGRSGVGKLAYALEFAKAVNCFKGREEACDACGSCRKADHGSHPDILLIEPDGRSIKNEQIKILQAEVYLKPYESARKVFIIEKADTMTPQAQNSLLKVLEEPPAASILILISSNPEGLLPTVVSRCQRIRFNRIARGELMQALGSKNGLSADGLELAASMADGSLTLAEALAKDGRFSEIRESSLALVGDLIEGKTGAVVQGSESILKLERGEASKILELMLAWFRDLSVLKETKNEQLVLNRDKMDRIKALSRRTEGKALYKTLEASMEAIGQMQETTANQQMVVDHLILQLQEALQ